jgi:hypothetical protein
LAVRQPRTLAAAAWARLGRGGALTRVATRVLQVPRGVQLHHHQPDDGQAEGARARARRQRARALTAAALRFTFLAAARGRCAPRPRGHAHRSHFALTRRRRRGTAIRPGVPRRRRVCARAPDRALG